MPKLVVLLRVKDGFSFVHDWLSCFEKLADEIVVVDNGSTDGTFEILQSHPKVVDIARTEGYYEGRDKNLVYAMARKRNPDWCLWIDVDEVFEPNITRKDLNRLMNRKFVNKYGFRRFHFIDEEHFAGSGLYFYLTTIHDRFMWRESPSGYFEDKILDSPNVKGINGLKINTNFRLKHLGYVSKDLVEKKYELYSSVQPGRSLDMRLHDEKKIKWYDDHNRFEVRWLNAQLNWLQFKSLFPRAIQKLAKIIGKQNKKATVQPT
jgi:glycosyltransferase involved in cell wall biosynthesis